MRLESVRVSGTRLPRPRGWLANVPQLVWAPGAASVLLLAVGVLGLAAHQPWLFPSLGPTAYFQAVTPEHPATRFYNIFVGHLVGLAAGFAAVWIVGAQAALPVVASHDLTPARLWAAVLALGLTTLVALLLRASHPPAGATTLLVALGSFNSAADALIVVSGVLLLAVLGEIARFLRAGEVPP